MLQTNVAGGMMSVVPTVVRRCNMRYRGNVMSHMNRLSDDLVHGLGNLNSGRFPANYGRESVVVIGVIIDDTMMTIGIQQTVLSVNLISVAGFVLALDISSVAIVDRVREFVVRRGMVLDLFQHRVVYWSSMDGGHVMYWGVLVMDHGCGMELDALMGRSVAMAIPWKHYGVSGCDYGGQQDELEEGFLFWAKLKYKHEFVLFATLVAAASAGLVAPQHGYASSHQTIQHHAAPVQHVAAYHAAPVHHVSAIHAAPVHHTIVKEVEHHAPANYEFSYSVHDEHTGDIKSQHETRHGDEVHGQYSLLDSDGHQRIVDYHADHHSGFNAVVRREPTHVKVAQPVHKVIAQPVHHVASHHAHIAPVAHISHHSAPIVHQHHVAPVAHATISHVAPIAHYGSASHGHHATSHISQISHNNHYDGHNNYYNSHNNHYNSHY